MTNDLDLLEQYTRQKSEEAFAALVNRHLDLVYSAALRQVRSRELAEEITQSVFADLARSAHKLKPDTILTAWLYQVTHRTAVDVIRRESRRQFRERIAVEMTDMNSTASDLSRRNPMEAEWTQIEPLLDEAIEALDDTDRAAVLLRYFENKSLREVGATLGTSDDAAQKRVSRAVERLREFFAKRGITVGASGLVVVISGNAVQAAPVGLAVTISAAAALAGTTVAATVTATTTKAIAMTTLQKTLVTVTLAVAVGAGIYEARQASTLRSQVQTLQQQQAPLAEQIQQLQNDLAVAKHNNLMPLDEMNELLKSRAEILRLRQENKSLATDLKKSLEQTSAAAKALSNAPPIKTFVAFVSDDLKWNEAIITGGLKTPSGKRMFHIASAVMGFDKDGGNPTPVIISKQLEIAEEACERLGLKKFYREGQSTYFHDKLTCEQYTVVFNAAQNSDGVTILEEANVGVWTGAPHEGRWGAQTSFHKHQTPSGDDYSVGSSALLDAVLSADGNSVRLVMGSQYNALTHPESGQVDSKKAEKR